jgi:hypothetical protein
MPPEKKRTVAPAAKPGPTATNTASHQQATGGNSDRSGTSGQDHGAVLAIPQLDAGVNNLTTALAYADAGRR